MSPRVYAYCEENLNYDFITLIKCLMVQLHFQSLNKFTGLVINYYI